MQWDRVLDKCANWKRDQCFYTHTTYKPTAKDNFNFDARRSIKTTSICKDDWLIFKLNRQIRIGQVKIRKRDTSFVVYLLQGRWPGPYTSMKFVTDRWIWESTDGAWPKSSVKAEDVICGIKDIKYVLKMNQNVINEHVMAFVENHV